MKDLILDQDGRIAAVASDRMTGQVVGGTRLTRNEVEQVLATGRVELGTEGVAPMTLGVAQIRVESGGQSLLLLGDPPEEGTLPPGAGYPFELTRAGLETEANLPAVPYLLELEQVIARRATSNGEKSYTKSLLEKGAPKIGEKLREEAGELAQALAAEAPERVASEAADVLFHLMVGLRLREVSFREVVAELARRAGVSGHEEKARRTPGDH